MEARHFEESAILGPIPYLHKHNRQRRRNNPADTK